MAVRQDKIQVSIAFLTDESKQFAKLIEDNKKFINDINTAKKEGKDLSGIIGDVAKRGAEMSKIDMKGVAPTQLIQRAKQLQQILQLIPQSAPEYKQLEAEYKKINDQLAEMRQRTAGVAGGMGNMRTATVGFLGGLAAGVLTTFVSSLSSMATELFKTAVSLDVLGRKSKTVFGEATTIVEQFADANAASMGLTRAEYIAAATAIGDLLIPMGFQRTEAANIASQLTNLSGALAEWTGGQKSSTEVSSILTKALLGERDELKSLGIAISEDSVKAELAAQGKSKLTGKALEQAKAMATLKLIMEKSTDAQTSYAQNSESLVRQQAKLTASLTTIKEGLASALIPLFSKVAGAIAGVIAPMRTASQSVQELQFHFNAELNTLKNANISQENRKKLIADINTKYKKYLPYLLTEKSSIDEIRIAQDLGNKSLEKKFVLLAAEEKFVDISKRLLSAKEAELELNKNYEYQQEVFNDKQLKYLTAKDKGKFNQSGETTRNANAANVALQEYKKLFVQIEENKNAQKALQDEFDNTRKTAESLGVDINKSINPTATATDGGSGKAKIDSDKLLKNALERIQNAYDKRELQLLQDKREGIITDEQDYESTLIQLKLESLRKQVAVYQRFGKLESSESIKLQKERLDLLVSGEQKIVDLKLSAIEKGNDRLRNAELEKFSKGLIQEETYNLHLLRITQNGLSDKLNVLAEANLSETDQAVKLGGELLKINKEIRDQIAKEAAAPEALKPAETSKIVLLNDESKGQLLALKARFAANQISQSEYEAETLNIQMRGIEARLFNLNIEGKRTTEEYRTLQESLLDFQIQANSKRAESQKATLKTQGEQAIAVEAQAFLTQSLDAQADLIKKNADKELSLIDTRIAALAKDEDSRRRNFSTIEELEQKKIRLQEEASEKIKRIKKGEVIISGLVEVAKIWETYAALPFIAVALTALAAGRTGLALKTIEGQSFAEGGRTGNGFERDHTGHRVAGYVHDNEYVVPKWMATSTEYAPMINWMESRRLRGYAQGGYVNTTPTITATTFSTTQNATNSEAIDKLIYAVDRLSTLELRAKVVHSDYEKVDTEVRNVRALASY